MATTTNMLLDKPVVSNTAGPLWATMLNEIADVIDVHDHSYGKGVQITPSGINVSSALEFNENDATELRSVRFASQSALMSLAADVSCAYVKDGELYFRDASGTNVQITSGGTVNAAALASNIFPQANKTGDYTILPADTEIHFTFDAFSANRICTLPAASAVTAGRYYLISDKNGDCSASRSITITAAGADTINGATTSVIAIPYGCAIVVRTSTSTWRVLNPTQLATTTKYGQLMLTNDLGGTAYFPQVLHITGTGTFGYTSIAAQTMRWGGTITAPVITHESSGGFNGETFTIQSQLGSLTGGDLVLKSGAGSTLATAGDILLKVNTTEVLGAVAAATPYARIGTAAGLVFASALTSGVLGFEARTTAGNGADIVITGQNADTAGNGGSVNLNGASGIGATGAGGVVVLTGGGGAGTGIGGRISLVGGDTTGSATGGNVTMLGGSSSGTGAGGVAQVTAGSGGGNANGGDAKIRAGSKAGSGLHGGVLLQLDTGATTMLHAAEVAASRNVLALLGSASAVAVPGGHGVLFLANATTAPSTSAASEIPVGGVVMYSDAGRPAFKTTDGQTTKIGAAIVGSGTLSSAASASTVAAGGGGSATFYPPVGYLTVTVNGTDRKVPFYN